MFLVHHNEVLKYYFLCSLYFKYTLAHPNKSAILEMSVFCNLCKLWLFSVFVFSLPCQNVRKFKTSMKLHDKLNDFIKHLWIKVLQKLVRAFSVINGGTYSSLRWIFLFSYIVLATDLVGKEGVYQANIVSTKRGIQYYWYRLTTGRGEIFILGENFDGMINKHTLSQCLREALMK